MTKLELEKYVGRTATWRPKMRSDSAITVPVVIEAVQQRYGRDEVRVHPKHGTGAAWVWAATVTLKKV